MEDEDNLIEYDESFAQPIAGYIPITPANTPPTRYFQSQVYSDTRTNVGLTRARNRGVIAQLQRRANEVSVWIETLEIECAEIGSLVFNELEEERNNVALVLNSLIEWHDRYLDRHAMFLAQAEDDLTYLHNNIFVRLPWQGYGHLG